LDRAAIKGAAMLHPALQAASFYSGQL
jgi:hypothetical protein